MQLAILQLLNILLLVHLIIRTKILVTKLSPIWKPNVPPTAFIIKITIPPKTEFNTNFNIFFIGTIKILPSINIKQIHAKYVIMLISILSTPNKNDNNFLLPFLCRACHKYYLNCCFIFIIKCIFFISYHIYFYSFYFCKFY